MPQKWTYVGAAVGATVVVGGALYLLSRKKEEEEGDAEAFSKTPNESIQSKTTNADRSESSIMRREYSYSVPEEKKAAMDEPPTKVADTQPNADGVLTYPNLGVLLQLQPGWSAHEDVSPMPNIVMINIQRQEFKHVSQEQAPMGAIPVLLLTVEDTSQEGLNLTEFKEKSKNIALSQMLMMTQGMYQPNVTFDGPLEVGPFRASLEYAVNTPFFSIQVLNLLTLENGLAYVFQYMASPDVFNKFKPSVMNMAKNLRLNAPKAPAILAGSYVEVNQEQWGVKVRVPSLWLVNSVSGGDTMLEAVTASQTKSEKVTLYKNLPSTMKEKSRVILPSGVEEVKIEQGSKKLTGYAKNGCTLVAVPKGSTGVLTPEDLQRIAMGVDKVTEPVKGKVLTFASSAMGIQFDVMAGSKLVESRISDNALIYAPLGVPTSESDEEGPMLTIRVGDPSSDPDCRASLAEWKVRLEEEQKETGTLKGIKVEKLSQGDVLTFTDIQMTEVGPGQREERTAKVYIFMKGLTTALFRWECPTGAWPKHQGKLNTLIESFKFL